MLTPYIIQTLAIHPFFTFSGTKISVKGAKNRPRGALLVTLAAVRRIFIFAFSI
jgi:hypothetical protein